MKKILILICTLLIVPTLLVSCADLFGGGGNTEDPKKESKYKQIVYTDISIDLLSIRSGVSDILGMTPTVLDSEPTADSEIVFGKTNRAISAKAASVLASELAKKSGHDVGYIIYKEGNNLAVYWSLDDMASIATEKFISICIKEKKLELLDGIIYVESYKSAEFEKNKYWLMLEAVATDDEIEALRQLYYYFDGSKIADFFANLWDGEVGGFYYTIGARDNLGYLPDLESTRQILGSIKSNGAIDDMNAAFPADIKLKIVNFAKNMQSENDGYFYHPQWEQDKSKLQTDRYGRDIGSAIEIINTFKIDTDGDGIEEKQYPNFCSPDGTKCELHAGTSEKCSFVSASAYYTDRMDGSMVSSIVTAVSDAVSRVSTVKPVASVSSHPDYSSAQAFYDWLVAYNSTIKEDSGKAHNLSAIRSEITQHGYSDIVLDYLDQIQAEVFEEQLAAGEEPTGLWQKNINYKAVWGFLKYSGYYNAGSRGRAIGEKYFIYIIKTFVKVIALPADGDYASNDIYNQWDGIARLIDNAKEYYGDDLVEEIRGVLRENAADLIDNTLLKIDDLAIGNGTFALNSNLTSPSKMYGASISPGIVEGNVNSTNILVSTYRSVFESLGYTAVPIMSSADGERFIDTICTIGNVEKNQIESVTIDFEDGEMPIGFKYSTNNSDFNFAITDDPDEGDGALYIESPTAGNGDYLYFTTAGMGNSCYIFESDIFVSSDTYTSKTAENIVQIKLGHYASNKLANTSYLLILKKNGNKLEIIEASATSGGVSNLVATVKLDEWFKLRLEYYPVTDDENSPDVPSAKIWVDEELIYTSEGVYFNSHDDSVDPYFGYDTLNIYMLKNPSTYMYLDNCYFSKEDKSFDIDDDTISDSRK